MSMVLSLTTLTHGTTTSNNKSKDLNTMSNIYIIMKTESKQLGKILQHLRTNQGYTQIQIANYLGISQPLYSQLEKGNRTIQPTHAEKLSILYNTNKEFLLGETNKPRRNHTVKKPSKIPIKHLAGLNLNEIQELINKQETRIRELEHTLMLTGMKQ